MSAGPVLPTRFVGAWARESLAVGGGDPSEPQVVRYLQAERSYADLRLDADSSGDGLGPLCFAGTASWDAPCATWHHEVDLELDPGTDRGEVTWLDGGRWSERGTFAGPEGPVEYVEVWRPLPVGRGGLLALRGTELPARLVQVGDHLLVVVDRRADGGGFAARYDRRDGGAWHTILALGDAAPALPEPPADRPPVGATVRLGGIDWIVDESSPTLPLADRPAAAGVTAP